jgi:hypothetical protein
MSMFDYDSLRFDFDQKAAEVSYDRESNQLLIDARNSSIDDSDIAGIMEYSNITYLNLFNTSISDRALRNIAQLERLELLDIGRSLCTDHVISYIQTCNSLRFVGIAYLNILQSTLMHLTRLKRLDVVHLDGIETSIDSICNLVLNTSITEVSLKDTGLNPESFVELDVCGHGYREVILEFDDGRKLFVTRPGLTHLFRSGENVSRDTSG